MDCILAVVNSRVITLTDVKIAEAFGLYAEEIKGKEGNSFRLILEKVIDQKAVIGYVREAAAVGRDEVEFEWRRLSEGERVLEFQQILDRFGLKKADLESYLQEKLLYQKIIADRFSQSVTVTLSEIETYYEREYIPSEKEKGRAGLPLVQVLDEIEIRIKRDKIARQVVSWIESLRAQADIQVREDCLKQLIF
jgi:hypothetical protein